MAETIEQRFAEIRTQERHRALADDALRKMRELVPQGVATPQQMLELIPPDQMESDEEFDATVDWFLKSGDRAGLKDYIKNREKRLQELSLTDQLTGLRNRRAFDEQAPLLFDQAKNTSPLENEMRKQIDFSLIFVDIDHFKKINDTYSHDAGDEALKVVAEVLRACTRPSDLVCRYGGEEFVVGFLGVQRAARLRVAERIRRTLEETVFTYRGTRIPITASIGAAKYKPGESFTDLVSRADQAMYAAKQSGRNRVMVSELPKEEQVVPTGGADIYRPDTASTRGKSDTHSPMVFNITPDDTVPPESGLEAFPAREAVHHRARELIGIHDTFIKAGMPSKWEPTYREIELLSRGKGERSLIPEYYAGWSREDFRTLLELLPKPESSV